MEKIESIYHGEERLRIDVFTAQVADVTRSRAAKLIEDGYVLIDGKTASKNDKLNNGSKVTVTLPDPVSYDVKPENIPLDIVYEDDALIIVNKPRGMVVHPAAGNFDGTLVNALLFHCKLSSINGSVRPGIVHRIDKDTSGLLVVAKTNAAHEALSLQLKERKALRKYQCIVNGNIKEDEFTVDKPIGRHPTDRKKMAIIASGRNAVTHIKVLQRFGQYTLLECTHETGRTHQIRVHLAYIGHSIVGDPVYGIKKEKYKTDGQILHAKTLAFSHPTTGTLMQFDSELPPYFTEILNKIETDYRHKY